MPTKTNDVDTPAAYVLMWHWQDGTVGTTGPYRTREDAKADGHVAVARIVTEAQAEVEHDGEDWTIGDPDDPYVEVQVQRMGTPSPQYRN